MTPAMLRPAGKLGPRFAAIGLMHHWTAPRDVAMRCSRSRYSRGWGAGFRRIIWSIILESPGGFL
jgi:hypothetical protein